MDVLLSVESLFLGWMQEVEDDWNTSSNQEDNVKYILMARRIQLFMVVV